MFFVFDLVPSPAYFQALANSSVRLPKGAETVVVEGGNHRGFASYAWQPLDWEVRDAKAANSNSSRRRLK